MSTVKLLPTPITKLPLIESVPVVSPLAIPGATLPLLVSVLPAPTSIVPEPVNVPLLVNPPSRLNVAPATTATAPLLVKVLVLTVKVCPAVFAMMLPLLTRSARLLW